MWVFFFFKRPHPVSTLRWNYCHLTCCHYEEKLRGAVQLCYFLVVLGSKATRSKIYFQHICSIHYQLSRRTSQSYIFINRLHFNKRETNVSLSLCLSTPGQNPVFLLHSLRWRKCEWVASEVLFHMFPLFGSWRDQFPQCSPSYYWSVSFSRHSQDCQNPPEINRMSSQPLPRCILS